MDQKIEIGTWKSKSTESPADNVTLSIRTQGSHRRVEVVSLYTAVAEPWKGHDSAEVHGCIRGCFVCCRMQAI